MGRKKGSPSDPTLLRRRIEIGSSWGRGLETAVDGAVDGAEGPDVYPLTGGLRRGEVCPAIIELRSETGLGCFWPSLLMNSLSEPGAGDTGCLRNSTAGIAERRAGE